MEIVTLKIPVTTAGSAGSAVGSAISAAITGWIEDIYLDFHASAPATTDTTIEYGDGPHSGADILVVTSSATDALIAPRAKLVDNTNTAIADSHAPFAVNGTIKVSLAQCDALVNAVVASVRVRTP